MTDSLMAAEQWDLREKLITRELFDEKLESHRQNFYTNMKNLMLPDAILSKIGQRYKYLKLIVNRELFNLI